MEPELLVPDGLPSLASGAHHKGQGQACVMELVSVLAGEEWSDNPRCVHPLLRSASIMVNDALPNAHRHLLLSVLPRLFNTNTEDNHVTERLREHFLSQVSGALSMSETLPESVFVQVFGQSLSTGCDCAACSPVPPMFGIKEAKAKAMVAWLAAALDVYDECTGREERVRPITEREAQVAHQRVFANAQG